MKVLVAYSSRHGSTAGIAQRIAERLTLAGHTADATQAGDVDDVESYDAFVVGGAAYMFHWLKDTTRFLSRHRAVLEAHPVWLFSSGPVGTDLVDEKGRDIFEATRPKEFDTVGSSVHPRGERVFFGAWDPNAPAVGLADRFMKLMPAARSSMPVGDFRDWDAIDAWADEIANELD